MKYPQLLALLLALTFCLPTTSIACRPPDDEIAPPPPPPPPPTPKIQVALLLDTSSSMEGLIEQAKSQLWNVVNTLSLATYKDQLPELQIALYEYGNSKLKSSEGYIRRVAGLGSDLDKISEELFDLTVEGGKEYCAWAIATALEKEKWSTSASDVCLILVAGNEPFNQGQYDYREVCSNATLMNVSVSTIHCGLVEDAIRTKWKDGADIGKGKFFNIDHNVKTAYTESPYDDDILALNEKLNATYIPYGAAGATLKQRQLTQDMNAYTYSKVNAVNRAVAKSSVQYVNSSWDLVDAVHTKKVELKKALSDSLYADEIKSMSIVELRKLVAQKENERTVLKEQINQLDRKRREYFAQQKSVQKYAALDEAIISSIKGLALVNGYSFTQ